MITYKFITFVHNVIAICTYIDFKIKLIKK